MALRHSPAAAAAASPRTFAAARATTKKSLEATARSFLLLFEMAKTPLKGGLGKSPVLTCLI
jgi:hypothetical protein